jgi:DNA-binding response OmpR family regulator
MSTIKKRDILFIKDENSEFDTNSSKFGELFNRADIALDKHKALKLIYANDYDMLIHDITVDYTDGFTFVKQIQQMKPTTAIFAFVAPKDEPLLGELMELNVDAYLLNPEDLTPALEHLSEMVLHPITPKS